MYKKPIPGLVAFTIAFLSQWLGHTAWAFMRGAFGSYHPIAELTLGAAGALLIATGLKKDEITATWMGLLGGLCIWVGWFEFTFDFFGGLFAIPDFTSPTGLTVPGSAALLMSTLPIMLSFFALYGFLNRQTKCNLMRWFHRNSGASPGMPTSGNGRSFARIAAIETVLVIWFCYLFWLYVGYFLNNTLIMIAYVSWTAWWIYIFVRLIKISRVGLAVRYGIPVGIVGWGVAEMPSHMGLYTEIWLKPFEYPVAAIVALTIFIAGFVYVARRLDSGATAAAA